jgi:hypothetical protein
MFFLLLESRAVSIRNLTSRKLPEQRRNHLHCGENPKSRKLHVNEVNYQEISILQPIFDVQPEQFKSFKELKYNIKNN